MRNKLPIFVYISLYRLTTLKKSYYKGASSGVVKHENPSVFQESMKAAGHILSTVLNNHEIGDNSHD